MNLKHFKEGKTDEGSGVFGIIFGESIFSVAKENDKITIRDENDGYYSRVLTKNDAIQMFKEAIEWINYEN